LKLVVKIVKIDSYQGIPIGPSHFISLKEI
jgi:hypothetical protein